MKKAAKFILENCHFIVFAAFLCMQFSVLLHIVPFGDDYYYMTFLRGGIGNFINLNVTHYLEVNGRAIVHLIDEIILADASLWCFRALETAVLAATVYLFALVISRGDAKSREFKISLCAACVLISVLDVQMMNETVYWATGAMNYVLPIPVMLLYYRVYQKISRGERLPRPSFLLAFLSCAMIEQCAFASLMITALIVYTFVLNKKKPDARLILCVLFSILGFAFLFLARGNSVRKTYYPEFFEMNLYERIKFNVKPLLSLIFAKNGAANVISLYLFITGLRRVLAGKKQIIFGALEGMAAVLVFARMMSDNSLLKYVSVIAALVAIFAEAAAAFADTLKTKDPEMFFFLSMALVLQGAMLLSPIYGGRTMLASVIFLGLATAKNLTLIFDKIRLVFDVQSLCVLCIVAVFFGTFPIANGYANNYVIHKYNMQNIEQYKENPASELTIEYLPDGACKYVMPYDSAYHEYWFKIAYGIDESTKITYTSDAFGYAK
ncbi:MAG: hypothetical protein KBS59_02920 [Clostridiales bacterium]|nr:hypothetical protein [Clostridiales bacterium]